MKWKHTTRKIRGKIRSVKVHTKRNGSQLVRIVHKRKHSVHHKRHHRRDRD